MIESKVICAFGDSRRYLKSLEGKKYVLYYSSDRKGVVAIGELVSQIDIIKNDDFDKYNAEGFNVKPVAPENFDVLAEKLDNDNSNVPCINIKKIKFLARKELEETDKGKFCWVATPKYPALYEETVDKIKDELNDLWQKYYNS